MWTSRTRPVRGQEEVGWSDSETGGRRCQGNAYLALSSHGGGGGYAPFPKFMDSPYDSLYIV